MTRTFIFQVNRVRNKFSQLYNNIKFILYSIKCGKKCCVHGHIGLSLHPTAKVTIGDNFYMSNGNHINPLSGNSQGHFHVEKNAYLKIGNNVGLSGTRIWCSKSIVIGDNVLIGGNVTIIDTDAHSMNYEYRRRLSVDILHKKDSSIQIGNDCFIGMNSIILKGVTIGERSVIGAGSVVTTSIPADCIATGNPAKVIKHLV